MNTTRFGRLDPTPTRLLRVEGLAAFVAATAAFAWLGGPIWLYVVLAFAPDLAMLGCLAGPRVGARLYNLVHTYTAPALLGGAGLVSGTPLAVLVALVWTAHVGADRLVGYGLEYPTTFGDTHRDRLATTAKREDGGGEHVDTERRVDGTVVTPAGSDRSGADGVTRTGARR
ncbi:DUF4260 domain-containing protein [Halobaculum sp. MBLA0147]|uniref:DUF4260 domain-containing protein n=1 Tax=Halobaculum sp. MBLA0147 TaxID=3079934 RepID=UPI0035242BE7